VVSDPPAPPTTSDVSRPAPPLRSPWLGALVALVIVAAVIAAIVALFFATWWLLQPGGWLHDAFAPRR
jgi:hypothetical protein